MMHAHITVNLPGTWFRVGLRTRSVLEYLPVPVTVEPFYGTWNIVLIAGRGTHTSVE